MKLSLGLATVVVGAALAGCAGGSTTSAARPAASEAASSLAASPTPSPCPSVDLGQPWPQEVPADLPHPPGVHITAVQKTQGGQVVRFTTQTSLRESVRFVVERLPKAGFVLGRGDAEQNEADAPFVHGEVHGRLKMASTGPCSTDWTLATVTAASGSGGTSPLLSTEEPSD